MRQINTPCIGLFLKASLLALAFIAPLSYASDFYCPGNNQFIALGMDKSRVLAACGKPSTIQKKQQMQYKKIPITQWYYVLGSHSVGQGTYEFVVGGRGNTLIVTMEQGRVKSISLGGSGVNASSFCSSPIQIGSSEQDVMNACGEPDKKNNSFSRALTSNKPAPMENWQYQSQYGPNFSLIFVNGRLSTINR